MLGERDDTLPDTKSFFSRVGDSMSPCMPFTKGNECFGLLWSDLDLYSVEVRLVLVLGKAKNTNMVLVGLDPRSLPL